MSTNNSQIDLIRGMDKRVDYGITNARQEQNLLSATVISVSHNGANIQIDGSSKIRTGIPVLEGMSVVVGERVLLAKADVLDYIIVGASTPRTAVRDATPPDITDPALVGLLDNGGYDVDPNPSDLRIQVTDDSTSPWPRRT
jgi:hypothetical protein